MMTRKSIMNIFFAFLLAVSLGACSSAPAASGESKEDLTSEKEQKPAEKEEKKDDADSILKALNQKTYEETLNALKKGETITKETESDTVSGLRQTIRDFSLEISDGKTADDELFDGLNKVLKTFGMDETDTVDEKTYTDLLSLLLIVKDEEAAAKMKEWYEKDGQEGRYDYLKASALYLDEHYFLAKEIFETCTYKDSAERAASCVQPFPETGELWHNKDMISEKMELEINVSFVDDEEEGRYIMIYSEEGENAANIFIGGADAIVSKLPGGNYRMKSATGKEWYGIKDMFGKEGKYENLIFNEFEDDKYLTKLEEGFRWTITINTSNVGQTVDTEDVGWEQW